MVTWSGLDVYDLEEEVSWLTVAGISTIMNRRIIIHAGLYAANPVECVAKLRECKGVICGLSAADILMGNLYPTTSMLLLFPAGRMASFAEHMIQKEGYQCRVDACDEKTMVLVRNSPGFEVSLWESDTECALLPAEQFTNTSECVFVGPGWCSLAYPDIFASRVAFQLKSNTLGPPSDEIKRQWKMRGFKWLGEAGFERRRGGFKGMSRAFDTTANVRFPTDALPLPIIM